MFFYLLVDGSRVLWLKEQQASRYASFVSENS
jgi:hypothetical protein